MKIVYTGQIAKKTKGCGGCGGKRTEGVFVNSKSYILPSRAVKTFIAGRPVEVSDRDGQYLLNESYVTPEGETKNVFEEVI